jgi:hypothetical protein
MTQSEQMDEQSTRILKQTALGIIVLHLAAVVLHAVAHDVLPVKATTAQLAFIIPVIIVAPLIAGVMLAKFTNAGMMLLTLSMLGSFVFGLYYHFIADTIDHVAHVAQMQPVLWSQMFQGTAYTLAVSEILGVVLGAVWFWKRHHTYGAN